MSDTNEEPATICDNERGAPSPAARRALAEAEARRRVQGGASALPPERNGRDGPEPTRFGDWEKNGIVSDF